MRKIVGLVVVVAMLLGVVVGGCDSSPSESGYTEVSVGLMTLGVPDGWQRPDDYEQLRADFLGDEAVGVLEVDFYGDASGAAFLSIYAIDMIAYSEGEGWSWEGWDSFLMGLEMSREGYADVTRDSLLLLASEITAETKQPLTIGGNESWEFLCTTDYDGDILKSGVLVVFGTDSFGVLFMQTPEGQWSQYEATWETIRDSVSI